MPLAKNNTQKAEIYALDAQGNTLAIYEIKVIDGQHELNCSERLIYGSSRLGMSKKIVNLGSQSGFDMQKMENSIYEFLDPQNAVANAVYVHPGFEKMYLGFKQYELNNHLGNVLSTVSDRKLTKRISDSQVYYVPDVRSATEYYPFGSMLEGWGCSQSFDCNLNTYSFTDTLLSDSYNTGLLSDLIKYPYYDYALLTGSSVSYYTEISGNRYLVFNSTTRNQPIMRRIYGVEDYKTYTARFRGRVTSGSAEITVRKYLKSDSTVYSNATSKVVSLNGTWKTDSISFTVDPLYRYTVHVRNSASIGATSINIDFIEVYGEASASYLTCSEDSVGYRYGFNSMPKDDELYSSEGSAYDFGARIYDSRLGRWLSVDPLATNYCGLSAFNYVSNNPISFIDLDGEKFVNPYEDDYQDAKLKLENAQTLYLKLLEEGMKKSEARKISNLRDAERLFAEKSLNYQKVENFIFTLKLVNRDIYDFFENLTIDNEACTPINIGVSFDEINENGTNVGEVIGLGYFIIGSRFIPCGDMQNNLLIKLYKTGSNSNITYGYESGWNFRTFTDELGDIMYFFNNVKNESSLEYFYKTSNYKSDGYKEKGGSGIFSKEFSDKLVDSLKDLIKNDDSLFNFYESESGAINKSKYEKSKN